ALVDLAPLLAVHLAPGGQRHDPVVEPLAAHAERVLVALVRAGDESIRRDRDVTPELAHRSSSELSGGGSIVRQMLKYRSGEIDRVFHALADPSRRVIVER